MRAALKQAETKLERDLAQAKHAREDALRYESLIQRGVVPQQQYDKFLTDSVEASEISYFSSNVDLTHICRTASADLTCWREKRWNPGDAQLFDSPSFL